jgi:cobalt-zinc-cadmium efflux system outer membrane protein
MRASHLFGGRVGVLLVLVGAPTAAIAQVAGPGGPPLMTVSMNDAVRLTLERNQTLRAQRLGIDESKADEITAGLKPNPTFSSTVVNFPLFAPGQLTWDYLKNNGNYAEGLSYLFERGGKRNNRLLVAGDTTDVTAKTVADAERMLGFQARQSFIAVLLSKSTLALAEDDLANFSSFVDISRDRLNAGAIAEGDFIKIALQKLQFEQDVSAAELSLVQAKAGLRQLMGFESVSEDFDVTGDLVYAKSSAPLDDLKRDALATRPDFLAAQGGVKLAEDTRALAFSNRARDLTGSAQYGGGAALNTVGFGVSIELPFHDRNQGNIARSQIAVRQASETESAARVTVLTDVTNAYAGLQTNEKIVELYQSGYLDQAQQSLDITTYVYQQGAGSLLDVLDAERTYRATQLAYRQALAAHMTSVQQLNFVVGRQVMP